MIYWNPIPHSVSLHCSALQQNWFWLTHAAQGGQRHVAGAWPALWRSKSITFCYVWEQQGVLWLQYRLARLSYISWAGGSSSWPTVNSPADWAEWGAWMIAWDLPVFLLFTPGPSGGGVDKSTHNTHIKLCDVALHTVIIADIHIIFLITALKNVQTHISGSL